MLDVKILWLCLSLLSYGILPLTSLNECHSHTGQKNNIWLLSFMSVCAICIHVIVLEKSQLITTCPVDHECQDFTTCISASDHC